MYAATIFFHTIHSGGVNALHMRCGNIAPHISNLDVRMYSFLKLYIYIYMYIYSMLHTRIEPTFVYFYIFFAYDVSVKVCSSVSDE